MEKKWRDQDWYWTIGILIAIIVLIFTFRLSDNEEVTSLFSFISSSVSIALALIAIFISLRQNSDNQSLTSEMSITLARIDEKIKTLDEKVTNLDPSDITMQTQQDLTSDIENVVKEVLKEQPSGTINKDKLLNEIEDTIQEKFMNLNGFLNHYYLKNNDDIVYKDTLMSIATKKIVEETNGPIERKALQQIICQRFNITLAKAEKIINGLIYSKDFSLRIVNGKALIEMKK